MQTKPKVNDPDVTALIADSAHTLEAVIEAIRKLILSVDANVVEGVKWNSPSFRTTEWFATLNLRQTDCIRLILHLGAKVKARGVTIADPTGLLEWLGKDRAMIAFADMKEMRAKRAALKDVLREWIEQTR